MNASKFAVKKSLIQIKALYVFPCDTGIFQRNSPVLSLLNINAAAKNDHFNCL